MGESGSVMTLARGPADPEELLARFQDAGIRARPSLGAMGRKAVTGSYGDSWRIYAASDTMQATCYRSAFRAEYSGQAPETDRDAVLDAVLDDVYADAMGPDAGLNVR